MAYKVFLFGNDQWLYCNDVSFEDGVYHGEVINGSWHLMYNTKTKDWLACHSREDADNGIAVTKGCENLTWVCDPTEVLFDYNTVIAEANERYKAGEPANFEINTKKEFDEYKKLKAKYEVTDEDEYNLYLELCEKYDDDGIPF